MRIVIVVGGAKAQAWRDTIASHLRDAQIDIWQPGFTQPADFAVGWTPPPQFFIDQPRLRAFFSVGAGVEHVLHNPNLPADLPIVRVEDAGMGEQMVDYCRFEVLRWMQRRDEYVAQQAAGVWEPLDSAFSRTEWPVGVFGLGVLGRQVASAFAADGFPVNAFARSSAATEPGVQLFAEADGTDRFEAFMRATKVLMILAPLTPATQDKFNRDTLRLLPRGSYVINVARGGLIVDEGLLELLDSGHLNGAALDVFRTEPLPAEHRYWSHPRVRVTPHTAAVTPLGPASKQIADKITQLAANQNVTGIVDRGRAY
ncbi:2-hydroxyacid dehydrogenase [Steroidobacter sp.]|uniref:2-hydroxyacid dehydrogenase n=1 Tax=Steroidobacter sp. TaxID=1978227 RepID=UPI001A529A0C|nr:glyoxylate/hydroxypyruvate reductase A [Steroidobacter sp.]MBL8271125.1 glyoxylate/hydroxypyruvate reductase A [Steroidobacter sp.]